MRQKIYEIPIDHGLTATRRKAIDQYIRTNAHLAPSEVSHEWEDRIHKVLHLHTPPVKWEIGFPPKCVLIHVVAPLWAYLLFTETKRAKLKEQIELMLHRTGFVDEKLKKIQASKKKLRTK